jgi:hypothetical protein
MFFRNYDDFNSEYKLDKLTDMERQEIHTCVISAFNLAEKTDLSTRIKSASGSEEIVYASYRLIIDRESYYNNCTSDGQFRDPYYTLQLRLRSTNEIIRRISFYLEREHRYMKREPALLSVLATPVLGCEGNKQVDRALLEALFRFSLEVGLEGRMHVETLTRNQNYLFYQWGFRRRHGLGEYYKSLANILLNADGQSLEDLHDEALKDDLEVIYPRYDLYLPRFMVKEKMKEYGLDYMLSDPLPDDIEDFGCSIHPKKMKIDTDAANMMDAAMKQYETRKTERDLIKTVTQLTVAATDQVPEQQQEALSGNLSCDVIINFSTQGMFANRSSVESIQDDTENKKYYSCVIS